jgi:chorismate mutase/prephenate dehydratase
MNKSLKSLRRRIDQLDQSLLGLLTQRGRLVKEVGEFKRKNGQSVFAPDRERELLARLKEKNHGPLSSEAIEGVFREVVHACRNLQQRLSVAYFGPEASFSHAAALKSFGRSALLLPARTISEVFAEVDKGRADFGVVPIENSTGGGVYHTLDMFVDSRLSICAELELPVHHYLLGRSIRSMEKIKTLYSHYQALAQCRNWVDTHLPKARVVESTSTAEAAKEAARVPGTAAIASKLAAERYGLEILAARIEDAAQNYTRFLVIGTTEPQRTGNDKTSIMFSIKDRPGALFDMLLPFKKAKLNLTKIESRPTRQRAWEYLFFVDFIGHRSEGRVQKALAQLERSCAFLKILGSYPRSE